MAREVKKIVDSTVNPDIEGVVEPVVVEKVFNVQQICDIKGLDNVFKRCVSKMFKGKVLTMSEWNVRLKEAKII